MAVGSVWNESVDSSSGDNKPCGK